MSQDLESMLTIPFWPLGPAFHRLCRTQPNLDPKVASALDVAEASYARSGLKNPANLTDSPAWSNLAPDQTQERLGSYSMLSKISETPELEKSVVDHPANSKTKKRPYPVDPSSSPDDSRVKLRLDGNSNQAALDSGNDQSSRPGSECVSTPITPIGTGKARRPTASDLFEEEVPQVQRSEKPKKSPGFSFQSSWNRPVGAASNKDGRAEQDRAFSVHRDFPEDRIGHRPTESSTSWAGTQPNSNRYWNFGGHKSRHSYTENQGHFRFPPGERERTNSTPETRDSRRSSFESASYSPNRTGYPDKDNYHMRVSHPSHLKGPSSRRSIDHVDENRPRPRKFSHRSGATYHSQPGGSHRHSFDKNGALSPGQGPISGSFSSQDTQRDPQLGNSHFGAPVALNGQELDPRETHFPLDKRIMYAIDRNVRLSTDQYIVEAFCRVGMWLERKGVWKQDDWGTLRATELARFLDIGGTSRLDKTLKRNFPLSFEQILVRARERKVVELDESGDQMIVHLSKDFTPRGLFYRPLIRSLKSHYFLEKKSDVEAGYLERNYLSKQSPNNKLSDVLPPGFSTYTYIQWAHGERVVLTSRDTETRKRVLVQLAKEWFRSSSDKDLKEVPKLDRSVMAQIEGLMAGSSNL